MFNDKFSAMKKLVENGGKIALVMQQYPEEIKLLRDALDEEHERANRISTELIYEKGRIIQIIEILQNNINYLPSKVVRELFEVLNNDI